jgi:nucleoside-diphosphate-sugar epimerase
MADHEFFLVGSYPRKIVVNEKNFLVHEYDAAAIERFQPTVLIDLAFVTREQLYNFSNDAFRDINNRLISEALHIFGLPSVEFALFTSSGAAVYPKDARVAGFEENPYGFLKRKTEDIVISISSNLGKKSLVMRPWSLSGTMVTKENVFAFSSFIRQSFGGEIRVDSRIPVYRRYVSAEDFLSVALTRLFASGHEPEIFDSGGQLISLVDLAVLTAELQDHEVTVRSQVTNQNNEDRYYSDNSQWSKACHDLGFIPETISEQVSRNIAYLRAEE